MVTKHLRLGLFTKTVKKWRVKRRLLRLAGTNSRMLCDLKKGVKKDLKNGPRQRGVRGGKKERQSSGKRKSWIGETLPRGLIARPGVYCLPTRREAVNALRKVQHGLLAPNDRKGEPNGKKKRDQKFVILFITRSKIGVDT